MPFTLPFTSSEITAFKDIALGLSAIATGSAAVATATFAYRGLNKWKDETAFKAKFELAKEIVETVYKASNTISAVSAPIFFLHIHALADRLEKEKVEPLLMFKEQLQTLHVQSSALFGIDSSTSILGYIAVIDDAVMMSEAFIGINREHTRIEDKLLEEIPEEVKIKLTKELERLAIQMNLYQSFLLKQPSDKVEIEILNLLPINAKNTDDTPNLYSSEQEALDEIIKSMQPHLSH